MNEILLSYFLYNQIITIFMYKDVMYNTSYSFKKRLLAIITLMLFGTLLLVYVIIERFIYKWRNYNDQ